MPGAAWSSGSVLEDAACIKALTSDELRNLKLCIGRGAACQKYWPAQASDLQSCDAAAAWVRAAMSLPAEQRAEALGPEAAAAGTMAPEPAWKKLPRSAGSAAVAQIKVPEVASANPYAGTSAAITPEEAAKAGWDVKPLTGALKVGGQLLQDKAALENPEAAAEAKEKLASVGMEEYAASDYAIALGRLGNRSAGGAEQPGGGNFPDHIVYVNGPGLEVDRYYRPMGCVDYVPRSPARYDLQNNCAYIVDVYTMNGPYKPDLIYGGLPRATLRPGARASHSYGEGALSVTLACLEVDSLFTLRKGDLEGVPDYEGHICRKHASTNGGGSGTAR